MVFSAEQKKERDEKVKLLRALFINRVTSKEIKEYTKLHTVILSRDILKNKQDSEVQKELLRRKKIIKKLLKNNMSVNKISERTKELYSITHSIVSEIRNEEGIWQI